MIQQLPYPLSLLESYLDFSENQIFDISCFSQIDCFSQQFFARIGLSLSCASSCARQRECWARFSVCGVGFQSAHIIRNSTIPGQQWVN